MRYLLMICTEETADEASSPEEQAATLAEYGVWAEEMGRRDGIPRNPGAWLTTAARNRAIDRARRAATGASKLREATVLSSGEDPFHALHDSGIGDDRLRLIFTCCHPALAVDAQVSLTLR